MLAAFTRDGIRLLHFLIAIFFAAAGTVIGAIGGLFSGLINKAGLMQGTLIGANTGAHLLLEFAESVLRIFCCEHYCMEARNRRTVSLFNLAAGNLQRGSVFTTVGSAFDSQIDALAHHSSREDQRADLVEPSNQVMAALTVHGHPVTKLAKETAGHHTTCIICLNELQAGEIASSLPACCHMFHLACIDSWFRWKSECPICRHPVY